MKIIVITKDEIMEKLINRTIGNKYFDVKEWSLADAEAFEKIANLIKQEYKLLNGKGD